MKRYLLDTCVLKWCITNEKRVASLAEDINYFQEDYAVSVETLAELLQLTQSGKVVLDVSVAAIIKRLEELHVGITNVDTDVLHTLKKLPLFKNHADPTDRRIIATAIATKRTLISGDEKFSAYVEYGLSLLEI